MRHLVIPDTQCKPGFPTEHLEWVGKYAAEKKPDVIVHLGDHWDMPSLSIYDIGKKAFEGRTYQADIIAGNLAMDRLMKPIVNEINRLKRNKRKDLILKNKDLNNVHYTFSHSELTKTSVLQRVTAAGVNVSVVFADKLPDTFKNIRVIDGDKHDRRYEDQQGIIVGLKFKGSRQDRINALNSGFAV